MFTKFMLKHARNKRGFTLIELIIVIAIIGILAAVVIPRFSNFRSNAVHKAAMALAKTLATAQGAVAADGNVGSSGTLADVLNYLNGIDGTSGATGPATIQDQVGGVGSGIIITSEVWSTTGFTFTYQASGYKTDVECTNGVVTVSKPVDAGTGGGTPS